MMEAIELPNRDEIRMLEEKETYRYLGKVKAEAETKKKKKKKKKRTPRENEKTIRNKTT